MRAVPAFLLSLVACGGSSRHDTLVAAGWDAHSYRAEVDASIDALLLADPVFATLRGDHRHDADWADLTLAGETRVSADLHAS